MLPTGIPEPLTAATKVLAAAVDQAVKHRSLVLVELVEPVEPMAAAAVVVVRPRMDRTVERAEPVVMAGVR
jgi:hypothetical protein